MKEVGQSGGGRLFSVFDLSQLDSSRSGGNVEIGCFDFQGQWESCREPFSVGFSMDHHFLGRPRLAAVLRGDLQSPS